MGAPLHILIADDAAAIRKLVRGAIGAYAPGARFSEVVDGVEALRVIDQDPVDCLILDSMMPKLDGPAVLRAVREGRRSKMPIIVVTARVEEDHRRELLALGASAVLDKPFTLDGLWSALRTLLPSREK